MPTDQEIIDILKELKSRNSSGFFDALEFAHRVAELTAKKLENLQ